MLVVLHDKKPGRMPRTYRDRTRGRVTLALCLGVAIESRVQGGEASLVVRFLGSSVLATAGQGRANQFRVWP